MPAHPSAAEARDLLTRRMGGRQVNKVLHSFPSPRLWRDLETTPLDLRRPGWPGEAEVSAELYVGVPFCVATRPDRCGYCLFPTEVYQSKDQLDGFLAALADEGRANADLFGAVSPQSVFFGGGTPNLFKVSQYPELLGLLRRFFPRLREGTPITMEGIPQLFTRDKLRALADLGVTRISMGAQQLNPALSALSGRTQKPAHVFQAVEWAAELGLGCNVDLIFGWPQQTLATMEEDLLALIASGVEHITHYELNVGGATDFALRRRDELPGPALAREMYLRSRELLLAHGYQQLTAYDFQRPRDGAFVYEECRRSLDVHEVWGWGYAAISDLPDRDGQGGWTFMNHRAIGRYAESARAGRPATERAFRREPEDNRLSLLFRALQALSVDCAAYKARFGVDLVDEHLPIWQAAAELGLLEVGPERITLTPLGSYYVPLLQTVLMQPRVEQLTDATALQSAEVRP